MAEFDAELRFVDKSEGEATSDFVIGRAMSGWMVFVDGDSEVLKRTHAMREGNRNERNLLDYVCFRSTLAVVWTVV